MEKEKVKQSQTEAIYDEKKYNKSLQPPSIAKGQLLAALKKIYYRAGILRENIERHKSESWTKKRNLLKVRLDIAQEGIYHIEEALRVMYKMNDEDFMLLKNYHYAKGESTDGVVRLRSIELAKDEQENKQTDK